MQYIICYDGGIIESSIGLFRLNGNFITPLKVKQLSNPGLNVRSIKSLFLAYRRIRHFVTAIKHTVDIFVYEHNAFVAPTIIQLIGAILCLVKTKYSKCRFIKYNANQIKKTCLGHAGHKYYKTIRRQQMKQEMVNFVNRTFSTNLVLAEHDSADVYGMMYTLWKLESKKKT